MYEKTLKNKSMFKTIEMQNKWKIPLFDPCKSKIQIFGTWYFPMSQHLSNRTKSDRLFGDQVTLTKFTAYLK